MSETEKQHDYFYGVVKTKMGYMLAPLIDYTSCEDCMFYNDRHEKYNLCDSCIHKKFDNMDVKQNE